VASPPPVPDFKSISATMRVDAMISDWRAELDPEFTSEQKERALYERVWKTYLDGDFGFGLWCWHECDRLTNAFGGSVREATRVLGPGHYLGFTHRRAIAERVPVELLYRPRKGDMSTPRPEAFVLPHYQVLCVYAVRAEKGDRKARAQLEIALGELEYQRRTDAYLTHFETFRQLLERQRQRNGAALPSGPETPPSPPGR
jgi:hypothetical protein